MRQTVCMNCEKPCEVITGYEEIDYEYGSTRGRHRVPVDISECCCAEIYEEEVPEEEE